MKLNLHGKLKEIFGESFEVQAETAEDAIRALTQGRDEPLDIVVDVIGFDTLDKLQAKTEVAEIDLVPSVHGGGGLFKTIIGALLVVAGFMVGGPLGAIMVSVGFSMVLSGVMQMFMKTPTISKEKDPDASKYLGLNKNTTAIGTPIKLAWGRINLAPHYLAVQADSSNLIYAAFPTTIV